MWVSIERFRGWNVMRKLVLAVATTGGSAAIVVLFSAVVGKVIAIVVGPVGTGVYGQLGQILVLSTELATLAGNTALVQGIASRNGADRDTYIITAFVLYLLGTVTVATILIVFSSQIAISAFGQIDPVYTVLVRWLGFIVLLNAFFLFLNRVLNGFRAVGKIAVVQIVHALVSVVIAYPVAALVSQGSTSAFFVLLGLPLLVAGTASFFFAYTRGWIQPIFNVSSWRIDKQAARHFLSISGTTLVTSLTSSGVLLIVRSLIVQRMGLSSTGIFSAAWSVSMAYASLILGAFGIYYLPTLSQTKDTAEKEELVRNSFRLSTVFAVPLITGIICVKPLLISLLYSPEYLSSVEIVRWMLMGDYFKIAAYTFATLVLAFPDLRTFLVTEMAWNLGFVVVASLVIHRSGRLEGLGTAFLTLYAVSFVFYYIYAYYKHHIRVPANLFRSWILGLLLIVLVSIYNWNKVSVSWGETGTWMSLAFAISWHALGKAHRSELYLLIRDRLASARNRCI